MTLSPSDVEAFYDRFGRKLDTQAFYANPALGFVHLDERYSTGSSLMPQKRNPDPLELASAQRALHIRDAIIVTKILPHIILFQPI